MRSKEVFCNSFKLYNGFKEIENRRSLCKKYRNRNVAHDF